MFGSDNENGILWLVIIFVLLFNGNGFGGNNAMQGYATQAEMARGFDNQNVMARFDQLSTTQTQGIYDNAQLINNLNTTMLQTANANQMATMQGFDSVNANINNLAHQMESCCCSLKTQMLQDKYDSAQNQLNLAEIASSNAVQTQNILNTMGRWYANQPLPYPYYTGTTIS